MRLSKRGVLSRRQQIILTPYKVEQVVPGPQLPGGPGAHTEVRANDTVKGTLILMLTAKGRDTDVAKGLGLGADAYMTKPFSTKELVQKVREMLERGA